MTDKSKVIFGNRISDKDYKKACKTKAKNIKKYGDDSAVDYNIVISKIVTLEIHLGYMMYF